MVAAVCVYPDLAHVAAAELKGSGVHVASVAPNRLWCVRSDR
jgi:deoxyribose-phosphate aldolase